MKRTRRLKEKRLTRTCDVCGMCLVQQRTEGPGEFIQRFMRDHTLKHFRQEPDRRHGWLLKHNALEIGVLPTGSHYIRPMI